MTALERWNTHFSTEVEQCVFDITMRLAQDPNSHNLGTTVWDASIVLAKYFEKNARKGEFSRVKVRNRRAVELGSGMGLAGMAFALLGAEVTLTDITDSVLTLLRRNVENNITPTALRLKDAAWAADCVGKVRVEELDWGRKEHYSSVSPPFDYVIAADCVYSEVAVPLFLATVLAMVGPLGVVIVCNEFRSQTVHDLFVESFSQHFSIRKVSMARMDKAYQHPLIHIYLMKRKKGEKASEQGLPY